MSQILFSRRALVLGAGSVAVCGCGAVSRAPAAVELTVTPRAQSSYQLGNTVVKFAVFNYGPGSTYFAPHYSERDCVAAAKAVAKHRGGRIIQLQHPGGGRNIAFTLGGTRYEFDPNRIFTRAGVRKTLSHFGTYSEEAVVEVQRFALAVRAHLGGGRGAVVALHNNTEGSYSLRSYLPGGSEEDAARDVWQVPGQDPDDFFLVTTSAWFQKIKKKGFSVVLQKPRPPDDGSLSVYAAQRGRVYINCEAQVGHVAKQAQMLQAIA